MKPFIIITFLLFFTGSLIAQTPNKVDSLSGLVGKEYLYDPEYKLTQRGDDYLKFKSLDKYGERDSISFSINDSKMSFIVSNNQVVLNKNSDTVLYQSKKMVYFVSQDLKVSVNESRKFFRKDLKIDYIDLSSGDNLASINCLWDRKENEYKITIYFVENNNASLELCAIGLARLDKERVTSDFNDVTDGYLTGALFGVFTAIAMAL